MPHPLAEDLDHVLEHARPSWTHLRGSRLFITGGTRFFGAWLLESLAWANERLGLGAKAVVLTRDPDEFRTRAPRLAAAPGLELLKGDIRAFAFPRGEFSHVIHAASSLNKDDSLETVETVVDGTRRALDFARQAGVSRCLYVSSGAVYGPQPAGMDRLEEGYLGAPDPALSGSTYGLSKRLAEHLAALYHERHGLKVALARAFTFSGPHLPLDRHNALGNFVRDGLAGRPIHVTGDGTPVRSYLHGSDLAVWLWTLLTQGTPGRAYNVGSESAVSVADLAGQVAGHFGTNVVIAKPAGPASPVDRYVPSTQRAQRELGLKERIGLRESIRRMALWAGPAAAAGGQSVPREAAR